MREVGRSPADRASHRPAARHATRDRNPSGTMLFAVDTHVAPHCSPFIVRAPNSSLLTSWVSGIPARRAGPGLRQEGRPRMYQPKSVITTAAEVKALLGPDFESQVAKIIDHIDPHASSIPLSPANAEAILQPGSSLPRLDIECHDAENGLSVDSVAPSQTSPAISLGRRILDFAEGRINLAELAADTLDR